MEVLSNSIFLPEKSKNAELGQQIRNEIETLANHFIQLDDQEKTITRNKKSIILELADKFEQLHELGEYPFPINNICNSIYRYLHRKGFDISDRYIQIVIKENAPQYINNSYQHTNSSAIDIKLQQEEVIGALKILKNANLQVLKDEVIQDAIPEIYEIIDIYEDCATERNITPAPIRQQTEQIPNYDVRDLDQFNETIKTDVPDARDIPSTLAKATVRLGESIVDVGKTIINTGKMIEMYPPDTGDDALEISAVKRVNEWGEFWISLSKALKSGTDRKYRRSIIQWMQIADTENDYGKHAASSKHPYMARFRDKDGNWKEEVRKLTREQIGDKAVKVREFTKFFRMVMPACLDWIRWSEIYMFPYASGLSTKLHDKLSDRSLR